MEIREDRIVFANIHNGLFQNKFNITVPFNEILALRYCFTSDISIFVIQPIYDSYSKLTGWLKSGGGGGNSITAMRIIPENFVMINFCMPIESEDLDRVIQDAASSNPTMKIIEINPIFAHSYLNTPNKLNIIRTVNSKKRLSNRQPVEAEVIHIEDDDDENENVDLLNSAILRYPENEANPIILYGHDLNCLRDGEYINDNIMNFYLKYFQHNGNTLSQEIVDKIYIYDALFSLHLLNQNYRRRRQYAYQNLVVYSFDSLEKTYHSVLKKWTRDIDIFSKDFIIMPLVKDSHWFLIILCYIGNIINEERSLEPSNDSAVSSSTKNKPTIIVMDSLNLARQDISKAIFLYLSFELKEKRGLSIQIGSHLFRELYPKVPQQQNTYDCGLFVLQYIEQFLKQPEGIYYSIIDNSKYLDNWFEAKTLSTKRSKIRQTILNLLPPEEAAKLETELSKINLDNLHPTDEWW